MKSTVSLLSFAGVSALRWVPEHARGGLLGQNPDLLPPVHTNSSKGFTLSVPLDHFATPPGPREFEDHYFIDDSCWDSANGPIFVEMGGEGGVGGARCGAQHRKHKAMAVSVEHRFYGASIPFNDRNLSNLQYLTVEQNLADTAAIIEHIQSTLPKRHRVINFGGSYSGGTAAWFRMAYPEVTDAAMSSSGVVHAILNFTTFDEQVAAAIELPTPGCSKLLRNHIAAMESEFDKGNAAAVKKAMGAANLVGTKMGDKDFWYMVSDGAVMADQYGHKASLCTAMAKPAAGATNDAYIANFAGFLSSMFGKTFAAGCFYDSECLKGANGGGMERSWRWQKCTELAYLQPSYSGDPVRSEKLSLEDLVAQCKYVFGDAAIAPDLNTAAFNAKYGGATPGSGSVKASKIFFSDYSDDPWNRASVQAAGADPADELPYCMLTCDGCGHCGSGAPPNNACSKEEDSYLAKWLGETDEEDEHY